jgi:hypothetical protein
MYQLVYRKHVWCSMMNTCLCEHVFGDVFNQFLSMCLMIICHTSVLKSRIEASIHLPRMFNHTYSNNMINR